MSTAWESNIALIQACDQAAELGFLKCEWCLAHGHVWRECSEYRAYLERKQRTVRVSGNPTLVSLLLLVGFLTGYFLRMLLEGM